MKKHILFSFLVLSLVNINAQTSFNRAVHSTNESPNSFVLVIDNDIYFTTRNNEPAPPSTLLYRYGDNGTLKSRHIINWSGQRGYKSFDDKIITFGEYNGSCGVPLMSPQRNFIIKMDTSGTPVFTSTYTSKMGDAPRASFQFVPDSSYLSFTDSAFFRHSKTGQFHSKTNLALGNISSAILLQNNTILVSAILGTSPSLIVVSVAGTILNTKPFPVLLTQLATYGAQKIMGIGSDGKLYSASASFNLLHTSSFTAGETVKAFVCRNDTVYSLLSSVAHPSGYALCDTMLNTFSVTSTLTKKIEQTSISLYSSKVAILSRGISTYTNTDIPASYLQHYFSSLNVIDKLSSNNFQNDLALVSVKVDSSYCIPNLLAPTEYETYLRVKVTVKNNGSANINNFKLNCYINPGVECGLQLHQELFPQLNLSPGDTITLTAKKFIQKHFSGNALGATGQSCLYLSVPNGETDKTLEDNELCKTFSYNLTAIDENRLSATDIKVGPNPCNAFVIVNSGITIKQIKIFNMVGVQVRIVDTNEKLVNLDISKLPVGIYFLNIETEKGNVIQKMIKN